MAAPSSGPYIVQTKAVTLMSVCARNIIERCGPLKYPFAESLSLSIVGRLRCQHAMTSQERFSVHSQLEHLQAKYVGTGHADTTKLCAPPRLPIACCLLRAPCPCADGFCR